MSETIKSTFLVLVLLLSHFGGVSSAQEVADLQDSPVPAVSESFDIALIDVAGYALLRPDVEMVSLLGEAGSFNILTLAERFRMASADSDIDAILVTLTGPQLDLGQISFFHKLVKEVQAAGKQVYVYSESYSQSEYLMACGCDVVVMTHSGELELIGLMGEALYFKGVMDKVGLGVDMISVGRYKSAAEQFTRSGPSQAELEQTNELLDDIYSIMVDMIARSRNMPGSKVRELIDNGPYSARAAVGAGLVDQVMYRDELIKHIVTEKGKVALMMDYGLVLNTVSSGSQNIFSILQEMLSPPQVQSRVVEDCIAVITIDGTIASGGGNTYDSSSAGSETIRNVLKDCRNNPNIKGVVVRIDSPGGSALASDVIYHAIEQTARQKPLVVSMGSVAASGGYYTACGSEMIFADEATITGSIGVVGGKVYFGELLEKVGVGYYSFTRGRNAGMLGSATGFSPLEKQKVTSSMLETYSMFKDRVLATRAGRIKGDLENLAQGRVFSGKRALELGLIDQIGDIEDAIDYVAEKCKLDDSYSLLWLPRPQTLMELVESLLATAPTTSGDNNAKMVKDKISEYLESGLGDYGKHAARLFDLISVMRQEQILTAMPYELLLKY